MLNSSAKCLLNTQKHKRLTHTTRVERQMDGQTDDNNDDTPQSAESQQTSSQQQMHGQTDGRTDSYKRDPPAKRH